MTLNHTLSSLLAKNRHPVCSIFQGRTSNVSESRAQKTPRLPVLTAWLIPLHAGANGGSVTVSAYPAPLPGKEVTQYDSAGSIARFDSITSPTKLPSFDGRATLLAPQPVDEQGSRSVALLAVSAVNPNCRKRINICQTPPDGSPYVPDEGMSQPHPDSRESVLSPSPGTSLGWPTLRFGLLKNSLREILTGDGFPADVLLQIGRGFSHRNNADIDAPTSPGESYRISYQAGAADSSGDRTHLTAVVLRLQGRLFTAGFFKPSRESSGSYFSFEGRSLSAELF
jgi:hypothetical protein